MFTWHTTIAVKTTFANALTMYIIVFITEVLLPALEPFNVFGFRNNAVVSTLAS